MKDEKMAGHRVAHSDVNALAVITRTVAVLLGIAGFEHGLFEVLQGNLPTPGRVIQAIGPAQRFWPLGTEEAFTLAPTYLIAGVASMTFAVALVLWSVLFLRSRYGSSVFILICILLFLAGGGIGQVAFFIPAWAFSTRIDKPARRLPRVLPEKLLAVLGASWLPVLAVSTLAMLLGTEAAVFGWIPGAAEPQTVEIAAMGLVLASAILNVVAFLCACAGRILGSGSNNTLAGTSGVGRRAASA